MSKQKIGIIGAGNIGGGLARTLSKAGYSLQIGVRDPTSVRELTDELDDTSAGIPSQAAESCDLLFLALPSAVAVDIIPTLGDLGGKIIVDCTNPLRWDQGPVWAPPREGSAAEAIASRAPNAKVIKAFNTFGAEFHRAPDLGGQPVDLLMAGDDADAKETLAAIANAAGFRPVDAGPLRNAALLENQAILWIHLAVVGGYGRDFAFQMVERS
jgi:predicted dinucleotide-binding enzyme